MQEKKEEIKILDYYEDNPNNSEITSEKDNFSGFKIDIPARDSTEAKIKTSPN